MKREQILAEIKRIAAANGNKPPGRLLFEKETSVRKHEWCGRYWARWNDAIREAGLEPNRKKEAYDESFLIEQFISLIREIRQFPTSPELNLKATQNPTFPREGAFRRFGGKQQLAARVLNYCSGRAGYDDVVAICKTVPQETSLEKRNRNAEQQIGYVYLGKSGKYYKVGRSVAPGQRERQLAIQLPQRFTEIHRISTDDPVGIEAYWHKRFDAKRTNGEFFALDQADVSAFKRRKFM